MTCAAPGTPVPTSEQRPAAQVVGMGAVAETELRSPHHGPIGEPSQSDGPSVETAIVLQVTAALLIEPPTELTLIEVDNQHGIVTLKGRVGSARLHTMAGEIANNHPGVEGTINALEIHEWGEPDQEADLQD